MPHAPGNWSAAAFRGPRPSHLGRAGGRAWLSLNSRTIPRLQPLRETEADGAGAGPGRAFRSQEVWARQLWTALSDREPEMRAGGCGWGLIKHLQGMAARRLFISTRLALEPTDPLAHSGTTLPALGMTMHPTTPSPSNPGRRTPGQESPAPRTLSTWRKQPGHKPPAGRWLSALLRSPRGRPGPHNGPRGCLTPLHGDFNP